MENFDNEKHWENIYQTKELKDVSWFQPIPTTSLNFFKELNIDRAAKIIDIGGGDSYLADHLLELGYQDISVLDISASAIQRAKNRLGEKAKEVTWIVSDITKFQPTEKYDVWHDRAAFHFLTNETDIAKYLSIAQKSISSAGILILGTFSENGPKKCSGIEIKQYSEKSMTETFQNFFEKIGGKKVEHITPTGSIQHFVFCSFKKLV